MAISGFPIDAGSIQSAIEAAGLPIDWVEMPTEDECVLHFPDGTSGQDQALAYAIAQELIDPIYKLKRAKIAELDVICKKTILGGFTSSALGSPYRYSSEPEDQNNLMGARLFGVDMPYVCTDEHGLKMPREHTAAQIQQVFLDGAIYKQSLIYHYHELRLAIEAATTVEEVAAINWNPQ